MSPERGELWGRLATLAGRLGRPAQFVLDFAVLSGAFAVAYLVRFDFVLEGAHLHGFLSQLPLVLLVQFLSLLVAGVYRFVWRYVGLAELFAFIKASGGAALLLILLRLLLPTSLAAWRVPLSIILVDATFAFAGVVALRVLRRVLYERSEKIRRTPNGKVTSIPVLLVGAGRAGVMAAKELTSRADLNLRIVGFVDDDPQKQGTRIQGIEVLGTCRDLPRLVRDLEIQQAIITIARASRQKLRRIMEICDRIPVAARIIPGYFDVLSGKVEISRIRKVEIEDLLGRDPVELDREVVSGFLAGKVVLVSGAGGSIGSELARQAALLQPSRLLLLEQAEFALFEIHRELLETFPDLDAVPLVADILDRRRVQRIMNRYHPAVVIHAAAHKHVPMMEANPSEAIKNNVLGTRTLAEEAGRAGALSFVLISTDKAVRPTSVMGASKRLAELVAQSMNGRFETRYVAVRFGNVLGSAGSVIPIFRRQIGNGGPVTVTHPDMIRYFMTIPEASQLVLQAGAMGEGGEIFILDMGTPVRIFDLAKDMISLSGLKPFEDVDIVFTGVRPGEKLFEELQIAGEDLTKTRHPKIYIGRIRGWDEKTLEEAVGSLRRYAEEGDDTSIRRELNQILKGASITMPLTPDQLAG